MLRDYSFFKTISEKYTPLLKVEKIYTMHEYEFSKGYEFDGESHDFWEMVFVDMGEIEVFTDKRTTKLRNQEIYFHKPNEFHALKCTGQKALNILIISFECKSESMSYFEDRKIKLNKSQRNLLAMIFLEAKNVYKSELGDVYLANKRNTNEMLGAEQLMYLYLETFLLKLIRLNENEQTLINKSPIPKIPTIESEETLISEIIEYLKRNIRCKIKLDDICEHFFISKTYLKITFKKETGYSVIQYFNYLKIEKAKEYIRQNEGNLTKISEDLGFDTVHYFSNVFKQVTTFSPKEYAKSIKAFEERVKKHSEFEKLN